MVAIAACLGATTASAVQYQFTIDQSQSSLGFEQYFGTHGDNTGADGLPYPHFVAGDVGLYLGPVNPDDGLGYPDPSNVAALAGSFAADIDLGVSIQLGAGLITPVHSYPYFPYKTGGAIQPPPGGDGVGGVPGALAQYGLAVYGFGGAGPDVKFIDFDSGAIGLANIYGLTAAFGSMSPLAVDGGAAMPNAGGINYTASNLGLIDLTGTEDIFSGAIVTSAGISGIPNPIGFGINAFTQNVTFDGTTLTIPVGNRITFVDGGTLYDITTFGQIVATGVVVPEPSSVALLACGAIGLVGYVVRRKRRA
ncbi:MAG: PEP-CTERM sorting domain-containing protein [Pirellulales bacterium]